MEVTQASQPDNKEMKTMFEKMGDTHPEILDTCEHGIGDKGYDDTELISRLWNNYGIKAVIDIRNMWKDDDKTKILNENHHQFKNLTYDYKGTIFCHCPMTGEVRKMAYMGFEKDRETLKYMCPAIRYGIECKGAAQCKIKQGVRVAMREDRRVFTPVARSSYKWKRIYNKRSSVERVNSRIETSFGYERHYIRGLLKMKLRCSLTVCVMLAMALGRAKESRLDLMCSLVKAA